jgi:enoyl-CoA hydratase/carnithine racemase
VNRVSPGGKSVVDDAVEWIAPIAQGAPIAQAAALEAVDRSFDVPLEYGLELEKVSYEKVLGSEDRREALRAFAEKRRPQFQGR